MALRAGLLRDPQVNSAPHSGPRSLGDNTGILSYERFTPIPWSNRTFAAAGSPEVGRRLLSLRRPVSTSQDADGEDRGHHQGGRQRDQGKVKNVHDAAAAGTGVRVAADGRRRSHLQDGGAVDAFGF
jgi:hypothetical protein